MKCNRVSTNVREKFKWTFWPTQYFDVVLFIFAFLIYAFEAISKNASESMIVAQCKPLPDSSVHEILQARILGWVATSSSRGRGWVATSLFQRVFLTQGSNKGLLLQAEKKILLVRLQHYANQEFPAVQAGFRKGRGTRDQIANIRWIIEKAKEF